MNQVKNKFTLKIIFSYLVIGSLAVVASWFIYSEYKEYISNTSETTFNKKFIETGTLINSVYETDGFSRIALLTQKEEDFELYNEKVDSLFSQIEMIKSISKNEYQVKQLDCVRTLLMDKNQNIEQLRLLNITSDKDSSLDDILREIRKLEESVGKTSLREMIGNPSKLNKEQREFWQSYTDWFNSDVLKDNTQLKTMTVDSMLVASRYIVREAKRENSRIRAALKEKENELIKNDLTISEQLRQIIAALDSEIQRNKQLEAENRNAAIQRTTSVLRIVGIIGGIVILLFSYIIITDFFKAEKFKRNLEEEKQYSDNLLKSREQLISTVSHDLKTPLNTILGYSELFENTELSDKQSHYIKQIAGSSNFVTKLVDDLLDFSKLEAGKLTIEKIPFSLDTIINQTANASKELHTDKAVTLNITIDDALEENIFLGDPIRIQQIVNNLIGNAFKFTEKGSISVSALIVNKQNYMTQVQISVEDTGIGISEEKIQLIFKEFTQAEDDTAQKFGGYGLGLAISKKLSELLDGSLNVESILGQGSKFILTLPLEKSEQIIPVRKSVVPIAATNLSALVFDDDTSMLSLLHEVLTQLGIKSHTCTSLTKAIKIKDLQFDFVLTDIQMPKMDGFELLKALQADGLNSYKNQPVIAMTGNREIARSVYEDKGFSDILRKPFTKVQLINALRLLFPENIVDKNPHEMLNASEEAIKKNDLVYDLELLESFMTNKKALHQLLGEYLKETERDQLKLNKAITNLDYLGISEVAHKMLTMKRQIAANQVIPLLEKLEKSTPKNLSEEELQTLAEKLNDQLNLLVANLHEEIS